MLSTPKLTVGLGRVLAGQSLPEDPSQRGPLGALPWLDPDGAVLQVRRAAVDAGVLRRSDDGARDELGAHSPA